MTKYRLVNLIDTSLNEKNVEQLVYVNKHGNFETFAEYMGPVKDPRTEKVYWVSDPSNDVERQRACDTIKGRVRCILPNTAAKTAESHKDIFGLFLDSDIMNIIAEDKYSWIKTTDIIELKALFGLMYFRGLL